MAKWILQLSLVGSILFIGFPAESQKFIRLDKINSPITKKFYIGDEFHFTTKQYPETWRRGTILDLNFDTQSMVFENELLTVAQMDKVRTFRPWAKGLGVNLYRFSGAWFVFGGIIHLTSDYKVGTDTAIIGGSAFLLGLVFDKILFAKTHRLSKRWKIRILDTTF